MKMANDDVKEAKKTIRKQTRLKHLLKIDGICLSETPTQYLVIGNVGYATGYSYEMVETALGKDEDPRQIIMIPNRQYSVIVCDSVANSRKTLEEFQGKEIFHSNMTAKMYLAYLENVPKNVLKFESLNFNAPPGLTLLDDFITEDYEESLVAFANSDSALHESNLLKQRKVKHFGFEFNYETNNIDKNSPLSRRIPEVCFPFLDRLLKEGHITSYPDQLTINIYEPGQGIPLHVDTHSAFEDCIISLSLNSATIMNFLHPNKEHRAVYLCRRSVLIMKGESRYVWSHGISSRKSDVIPTENDHVIAKERQTRISYTFRQVRKAPCYCLFPEQCDSQKKDEHNKNQQTDVELETTYVREVYEAIADHFNDTRHTPWPKVVEFLFSLKPGSLVIDVGCGNGKYFALNENLIEIGFDRSLKLTEICRAKNHEVFCGDIMNIPMRDGIADACLCIAVIHHLASPERRAAAIQNLVRLLTPGGKALIYVWAMEQEKNDYVKEKRKETRKDVNEKNIDPENRDKLANGSNSCESSTQLPCPVHFNRTHFEHQDILVPWHLRRKQKTNESNSVHHRYYHIFHKGELENLCSDVRGVNVIERYYDRGNWCVVLQKMNKNST